MTVFSARGAILVINEMGTYSFDRGSNKSATECCNTSGAILIDCIY